MKYFFLLAYLSGLALGQTASHLSAQSFVMAEHTLTLARLNQDTVNVEHYNGSTWQSLPALNVASNALLKYLSPEQDLIVYLPKTAQKAATLQVWRFKDNWQNIFNWNSNNAISAAVLKNEVYILKQNGFVETRDLTGKLLRNETLQKAHLPTDIASQFEHHLKQQVPNTQSYNGSLYSIKFSATKGLWQLFKDKNVLWQTKATRTIHTIYCIKAPCPPQVRYDPSITQLQVNSHYAAWLQDGEIMYLPLNP